MLRSPRTIISLLQNLTLGTTVSIGSLVSGSALSSSAVAVGSAVAATTLVACQDESKPEYWVGKLDDPKWRPRAVKRLTQFFEDAITKANNDQQDENVQKVLNTIIDPLVKVYVDHFGDLDTKTRVSVIKLLADSRDKRAEPALKKAFEEFAKRPRKTTDEKDIKWAIRAAGDMKLPSLNGPILAAFQKLEAHTMLGGITYKDYSAAMGKIADKSWSGPLIQMLDAEIKVPKTKKDADLIDDYRDQLFWQTTAAQVLGNMKDPAAVEPLLKIVLDPSKGDVATTALLALVKIGKPAVERAGKLLTGGDEKLANYRKIKVQKATGAKEPPKDDIHIEIAAAVLGTAGRSEGLGPMLQVLNSNAKDEYKAQVAKELAKIPATSESTAAFKRTFESLSSDTSLGGAPAQAVLTESAAQFYDASLVPWLIDQAANAKGSGEDKKILQGAALVASLKLAKPNQMKAVKASVKRYGTKLEEDMLALAEKVTEACGEKAECYISQMEKSDNQTTKNQFAAIKAGYMVGVFGNAAARDELIKALESIENAGVRFVAAQTIDQLTPKGSPEVVKTLDGIITKNAEMGDKDKIAGDSALKQVMYRIDARS